MEVLVTHGHNISIRVSPVWGMTCSVHLGGLRPVGDTWLSGWPWPRRTSPWSSPLVLSCSTFVRTGATSFLRNLQLEGHVWSLTRDGHLGHWQAPKDCGDTLSRHYCRLLLGGWVSLSVGFYSKLLNVILWLYNKGMFVVTQDLRSNNPQTPNLWAKMCLVPMGVMSLPSLEHCGFPLCTCLLNFWTAT